MEKLIITAAVTGAWPTKKHNPNIPLTPKEIADDVFECYKAGASVAHLHMRDDNGVGSMDKERFKETVERIRDKCDIILNLTTSGEMGASDEKRMEHFIELKPQFASFDAGSMNWMNMGVFLNSPAFLEKLGKTMKENGVKLELEIFDAGMIYNCIHYIKKGIINSPAHFQLCLGAAGGMAATVENLIFLKNLLPENSTWSAFGIGVQHMPILFSTIALGGHIRVGMEDNVMYAKNRLAKSNAEFVERAVRISNEFNREVATIKEAKKILNVK